MRKLITFILLALFLVSMVPVYAHEGEDVLLPYGDDAFDAKDIHEKSKPLVKPSLIKENKGHKANRAVLKEKLTVLEGNLAEAKDNFHTTKGVLSEIKSFCKGNPNEERCNGELTDTSKKYLKNLADTILKVLDKRKAKLEDLRAEIEDSSLENKDEIIEGVDKRLGEVNTRISKITEIRNKIDSVTNREELKELARMLKEEWKVAKNYLKVSGGAIVADRFAGLFHKADKLKEKLDKVLKKMSDKGLDTTKAQEKIDSFNEHLSEARKLVGDARAKFAEAKLSPDKNRELIKEGTGLLNEAQEHLKLAHIDLKEIVKLIKGSGEELESDAGVPKPIETED